MPQWIGAFDAAYETFGLGRLSRPAKLAAALIVLGAAILTLVTLALDLLSDHPSSTAPLILLVMPIYTAIALAGLAVLDWAYAGQPARDVLHHKAPDPGQRSGVTLIIRHR